MDKKSNFIRLIKEHKDLIFKVAAFYTNNQEDRDDLYQEIVYQLWKSFESFKGQSKISTWMYRVAMNTAIYFLKKEKRGIKTTSIDKEIFELPEAYNGDSEDRIKILYEQIQQLNLLEKGIMLLYLEGKNYNEIAAITGISSTNVGTKLSRVREKLKMQITNKK